MKNLFSLLINLILGIIFLLILPTSIWAQKNLLITGTVIDETGEMLISVNVTVKGSTLGANSLTQDNSPLSVIDGFPIESYFSNAIDPGDIESLKVLKDASATAIYGARGENGVIIITTKKGKIGASQLSYECYYGFQNLSNRISLIDGYNFVKLQDEMLSESSLISRYLKEDGTVNYNKYRGIGLDFQNYIFQTVPIHNHRGSLRSGTQSTKYSLSFYHMNQEGHLVYNPYTPQGYILPDFSFCGYKEGVSKFPTANNIITLNTDENIKDDTQRIQYAIDKAGKMKADKNGMRGAVLLKKCCYNIASTLYLNKSDVILRGEGNMLNANVAGPNAFVDCISEDGHAASEPHHRWATGCLFDNCKVSGSSEYFSISNRGNMGSGYGCAGAQIVLWNCSTPLAVVMKPPTAQNFAIGVKLSDKPFYTSTEIERILKMLNDVSNNNFIPTPGLPVVGDAFIEHQNTTVYPQSLYNQQLKDRLHKK